MTYSLRHHQKVPRLYIQHTSCIHTPVGYSNTLGSYFSHQMAEGMHGWVCNSSQFHNYYIYFLLWMSFILVCNISQIWWTKIYNIHITLCGRHTMMNLNQIWSPWTLYFSIHRPVLIPSHFISVFCYAFATIPYLLAFLLSLLGL
jgi:hypothetical protein